MGWPKIWIAVKGQNYGSAEGYGWKEWAERGQDHCSTQNLVAQVRTGQNSMCGVIGRGSTREGEGRGRERPKHIETTFSAAIRAGSRLGPCSCSSYVQNLSQKYVTKTLCKIYRKNMSQKNFAGQNQGTGKRYSREKQEENEGPAWPKMWECPCMGRWVSRPGLQGHTARKTPRSSNASRGVCKECTWRKAEHNIVGRKINVK